MFRRQDQQNRPIPHLNIRSDFLVFISGVPTDIGGKEFKRRLNNQYGRVRFVETFEAWLRRVTGNMIIEFSTYGGSEAFMQAAINNEIPFLRGAHVQHIGIVGSAHFFELVHRNTGVDLVDCDGQPGQAWTRNRSRVSSSQNSSMNRRDGGGGGGRRSRSRSPVNRTNSNNNARAAGPNQNQASGNRQKKEREQPTNTPSSDEEEEEGQQKRL